MDQSGVHLQANVWALYRWMVRLLLLRNYDVSLEVPEVASDSFRAEYM